MQFYGAAVRRGPSRAPTRARATGSRSPRTSATSDTFDRAIAAFAEAYADQNERDYEALQAAAAGGKIKVELGLQA